MVGRVGVDDEAGVGAEGGLGVGVDVDAEGASVVVVVVELDMLVGDRGAVERWLCSCG